MAALRLGMRAQDIPAMRARIQTSISRSFSTSPCSGAGMSTRAAYNRGPNSSNSSPSPSLQQKIRQQSQSNLTSAAVSMLFPGTFVRPPKLPWRKPSAMFQYSRAITKSWATGIFTNMMYAFASKPTFFTRAMWKSKSSQALLTAKALHRSMAEALAAGNKAAINRVCVIKLATPLCATIDARPRWRRYGWELVKYNAKPRILCERISPMLDDTNAPLVRQMVVSISSRQRRVEYDDSPQGRGRVVPKSEKVADLVENIVITTTVNRQTWQQDEWRVFGTLNPTSLKNLEQEKQLLAALEAEDLEKHKIL
ncbi:hypothetical protein B0H63DRAFT_11575 [Podospora didyma]|uniref:Uncharacterized protein n=1 Tax=Podospora didyma TaxID=330526 RepID=A0AAE0P4F4_9PEZI|nr:hypothetical protein B0H63DRAFT_135517 [Podospora didyma]KAK3393147.1 hypothetical protein B0H63DRAFT_11575 [Podospora didyma]